MATQTLYLSPISMIIQYLTNLGVLAQGGQVFTYQGGTVNTPQTTFTDSTGLVQNANPLTLNGAARPATPSGAPVAFWTAGGATIHLVVLDANGNQLVNLDQIPAINDLTNSNTSLQALLANPASANSSGVGPVAGVDLVANAVKSYDVFADVRAANAPTLASSQTLNIEIQGGSAVNDGLGGFFYWNTATNAADDGRNTLKPNSLASAVNGRWSRWVPLGMPQYVVAGADQTVTGSTVLVNDAALTFPLSVGTWLVSVRLNFLGSGGGGGGWKFAASVTATVSTNTTNAVGVSSANGTPAVSDAIANGAGTSGATVSTTTGDCCNLDFVLTVTQAGSFTVQWAQNSAANATVRKSGSLLIATRVA